MYVYMQPRTHLVGLLLGLELGRQGLQLGLGLADGQHLRQPRALLVVVPALSGEMGVRGTCVCVSTRVSERPASIRARTNAFAAILETSFWLMVIL